MWIKLNDSDTLLNLNSICAVHVERDEIVYWGFEGSVMEREDFDDSTQAKARFDQLQKLLLENK